MKPAQNEFSTIWVRVKRVEPEEKNPSSDDEKTKIKCV